MTVLRKLAWPALLALCACHSSPSPSPSPSPSIAEAVDRPEIALVGCRHVDEGACVLAAGDEATLRVWIDQQAKAEVMVEIDGRAHVPAQRLAVDGGQRVHLTVPERAEVVTITSSDPPWDEPFELRLVREVVPAVVEEAKAASTKDGIKLLRAALPELEGTDKLAALQTLHRLLAKVDPSAAMQLAREAAALAASLGRTLDFADCAAAVAGWSVSLGNIVAGREWALKLEPFAATLPEARVWARYYYGVFAMRAGDLNSSVRALEQARNLAERLGMAKMLLSIREQLATVLADLGRREDVLRVLDDIDEQLAGPGIGCQDRARARGNAAWVHIVLGEGGHPYELARPLLERQLEQVSATGECPDPLHSAFVNLALVALAEHEPEEALAWIEAQEAAGTPAWLRPWVEEITAQIGVATGRTELIPALVERPDPGGPDPSVRWMAIVRHARTLAGYGLHQAAVDSYLEAEALLEQAINAVGVDFGRERFLAGRRASAEELVELLVSSGLTEQAFCRARLARGRALRMVDRTARLAALSGAQRARREQLLFDFLEARDVLASERRDDWKYSAPEREHRERRREEQAAEAAKLLDEALRIVGDRAGPTSCEELPELPDGALTILQFPRAEAEDGSWIFVADHTGVEVRAATADDPALLEPFAERVAATRLIRVMPTGDGWDTPFHALPIGDGLLLDAAPVVYALDLPARTTPPGELELEAGVARAIVVANPSKDLPNAGKEADEVAQQLSAAGWEVARLVEAEATRARLSEALGDAALLHYAGHGTSGGVDGWGGALLLHDGDRLTVADILALPRVPEAVVLSGCDTTTVATNTASGGMNLGHAFVLAGARWVIGADGEVDDGLARALGEALHEQPGHHPKSRLQAAEAVRAALLDLREDHPDDWQAFRLVAP